MDPKDLLRFLQHIIVWIPHSNPIRGEIQNAINQLKASLGR